MKIWLEVIWEIVEGKIITCKYDGSKTLKKNILLGGFCVLQLVLLPFL